MHDRPQNNPFDIYVGALFGMGTSELRNRDVIPDTVKLFYAGRLACQTHNAEGLQAIVEDYMQCPVRIEEFVGEWLDLPADSRWRLGWSREVSELGRTTILGRQIWRCDHKFRVVLGPLASDDYRALLPGNDKLARLTALVTAYVGREYEWDVRLVLAEGASRQVKLNWGDRLGLYTQLGKSAKTRRRDDVIVHPTSHQTHRRARRAS
jgi:type VI secretion system protein ImpH